MTGVAALPLADEAQHDVDRRWAGVARVVGPAWTQLPSLTVGLLGVQMLWSVEMSYASPYLLSLGLPKSLMAIVFLAGPLSGLIVQPMIGILADNSKSRFGRRRPFILISSTLCALATLLLGFTRPFATIFTSPDSPANDTLTIWLAIFSIYCIDFCVNAVQALDRALLVDTLPTSRQPAANAWAASMLAVGSVAGFFVGNLDLPHWFPFFGSAQLQVLTVIAALLLFSTQAWVCFHVEERVLLASSTGPKGIRQELKELRETLSTLPHVIRQICWIQFFAWLGWFPVLFYTTVYIGDLHKRASPVPQSQDAALSLDTESTRLGTRALFYSALVSLVANVAMPSLVVEGHTRTTRSHSRWAWTERIRIHLCSAWALSHAMFAVCMAATLFTSTVSGATWIASVTGFCWAMTQWAPFALLGEAILSHAHSGSHVMASTSEHGIRLRDARSPRGDDAEETTRLFAVEDDDEGEEQEDDGERERGVEMPGGGASSKRSLDRNIDPEEYDRGMAVLGMGHAQARTSGIDIAVTVERRSSDGQGPGSGVEAGRKPRESTNGLSAQAGAIIGIHNMFIVVPQFLVTGLSSVVFALLDPDKSVLHGHHAGSTTPQVADGAGTDAAATMEARDGEQGTRGPNSVAIIFRLGGVAAVIAFVLCYRLAKDLKRRSRSH